MTARAAGGPEHECVDKSELESRLSVSISSKLEVLVVPQGLWWNNHDGTWRFVRSEA